MFAETELRVSVSTPLHHTGTAALFALSALYALSALNISLLPSSDKLRSVRVAEPESCSAINKYCALCHCYNLVLAAHCSVLLLF